MDLPFLVAPELRAARKLARARIREAKKLLKRSKGALAKEGQAEVNDNLSDLTTTLEADNANRIVFARFTLDCLAGASTSGR
jgi:hypothetical protein